MFCCLWLQCIQKYKTKPLKEKDSMICHYLRAVNIQKAFIKLVMIFESDFFVVLTASHLKLESELLIFVYNIQVILSRNEKKYCMTYLNSCNSTICYFSTELIFQSVC